MIVEELKKSILQYAILGKLTYSENGDTNIEDYYKEIIQCDKIKRKDLENKEIDITFDLPKNWKLVRLGDIAGIYGGKRIPAGRKLVNEDTGHKYIRVADMTENTVLLEGIKYIPEDIYKEIKNYIISKEDVYITVAGTIGKIGIIPDELNGSNLTENANKIVFSNIDKYWLMYALKSAFIQTQIKNFTTKVGQPKLAIKRISNIIIPLPAIEEQHRIVSKIEDLYKKIEELTPLETELESIKQVFPIEMKRSIIFSALKGKITEQKKEENVDLILDKCGIKSNVKGKVPFEIPNNWRWVKFGELVDFNIGKTPPRADSSYWEKGMYNWVSISDMIANGHIIETKEKVNQKSYDNIFKGNIAMKGTLLMSFKMTIGKCSIIDTDAFHHEGIISIYPKYDNENETIKNYLFTFLPFLSILGDYKNAIKGKTLNSKSLFNLMIPLPPIVEQERILKKISIMLPILNEIQNI